MRSRQAVTSLRIQKRFQGSWSDVVVAVEHSPDIFDYKLATLSYIVLMQERQFPARRTSPSQLQAHLHLDQSWMRELALVHG
jgi:hypothetical protein